MLLALVIVFLLLSPILVSFQKAAAGGQTSQRLRGWRNTVEIVMSEISNSIKAYTSVVHACTSKLRSDISLFEPTNLDEFSNRIPPTSQRSASKVKRYALRDAMTCHQDDGSVLSTPKSFNLQTVCVELMVTACV